MLRTSQKKTPLSLGALRPQELVSSLGIEEGMQVADFGSGAGDFAILLSKIVGKAGHITAIDIKEGAIESVRSRARFFGLNNISAIRSNLETQQGSQLPAASQDAVLCANILFQSSQKEVIMQEALRILKSTGRLIVIEWKSDASFGPHATMRMAREDLIRLIEGQGFHLVNGFDAGSLHFGLIFERS